LANEKRVRRVQWSTYVVFGSDEVIILVDPTSLPIVVLGRKEGQKSIHGMVYSGTGEPTGDGVPSRGCHALSRSFNLSPWTYLPSDRSAFNTSSTLSIQSFEGTSHHTFSMSGESIRKEL
jgi:hypothetical protein